MNFYEMTYNDFYMKRISWTAEQIAAIHFTKEEIEWAIYETEYKYFGTYEFTDQQQMAVDILVWCAKERAKDQNN